MLRRGHSSLLAASCILIAAPALAGKPEDAAGEAAPIIADEVRTNSAAAKPERRGWIEVSAFFPKVDSRIRVSAAEGPEGTEIDLERDLRLNRRQTLPAISASVPLGRSWALFAEIYQVDRSREVVIEEDIVFDGVVYPASANIASEFDSRIVRFGASHSVYRDADTDIDVSLGAHVTRFKTSIAGEVAAGGGSGVIERRRREVLAPLPTIGFAARRGVLPRLDLMVKADAFSLDLGEFEGRIINFQATLSYRFAPRLSLGVSYREIDYDLRIRKDDWEGRAKYSFSGPALSLRWNF